MTRSDVTVRAKPSIADFERAYLEQPPGEGRDYSVRGQVSICRGGGIETFRVHATRVPTFAGMDAASSLPRGTDVETGSG